LFKEKNTQQGSKMILSKVLEGAAKVTLKIPADLSPEERARRLAKETLKHHKWLPDSFAWHTLRSHYSLQPLFAAVTFGCGLAAVYLIRLATQSPDVSWFRQSNPEPWQKMVTDDGKSVRYKFYQGPEWYGANGPTKYGIDAFPPERYRVEKDWAVYRKSTPDPRKQHHGDEH